VYTWQENLVDPQRWNRYAYVRNNPLRYVDPDGRDIRVTLYYGRDGNRFGHIGVGVNSARTYGLDPVGPTSAVLRGDTVEGNVQLDTNEVKKTVVIPTTAAEDKAAEQYIADSRKSNQQYNLYTRNCSDFVREALGAAGIKTADVTQPKDMFANAQIEADRRTAPEKRKSNFLVRAFLAIMGEKDPQ
jgi:hypothetical protein